jgi:type 1 fimbria pilin
MLLREGEALRLPWVRTVGTGLTYDGSTGQVTVRDGGTYLFVWTVVAATCTRSDQGDILVALEDAGGGSQYALSGAPIDDIDRLQSCPGRARRLTISGQTVAELPQGGVLRLVNRSGRDIDLLPLEGSQGNTYAASLTIVRV